LSELLLLHAYIDGELDPINAQAIERRIAADPALAAERARLEALRDVMRRRLPRETSPPTLRARIIDAAAPPDAARRSTGTSWRTLVASAVAAAIMASGITWFVAEQRRADAADSVIVSAHVRGLMATQPFDVASADSHTVKPWFNGRIPQAVRVADLVGDGFSLAGGRIDVVGGQLAPTLIYRRRQHVISLTAVSAARPADIVGRSSADGYNIVRWSERDVNYYAISDLNSAELDEFAKLFRAATASS
jgi:anti-sigma factor RsiW